MDRESAVERTRSLSWRTIGRGATSALSKNEDDWMSERRDISGFSLAGGACRVIYDEKSIRAMGS